MASPQVGSAPAKLSFAKVAAMRAPALPKPSHNTSEEKKPHPFDNTGSRKPLQSNILQSPASMQEPSALPSRDSGERPQSEYVVKAIQGLSLSKDAELSPSEPHSAESGESMEDDQSHLSNSSTKQQSFDTKSLASVTTFAMDEKESIRPDDSASVRAADDDETSNTPGGRDLSFQREPEPSATNNRSSLRQNTSGVTIAARRYHTLTLTNPPRFGDLPVPTIQAESPDRQIPLEDSVEQAPDSHDGAPSFPIAPDEKLIEALATPKDRLPLLQLEEKFLAFIMNNENDFLDLPPQNSFARLLTHKLADYYSLAHHINDDGTSIRVFRTPSVLQPTPLHVLAQSIPTGPAHPPSAMAFKIMRRAGLGPRQGSAGASTPASSSVPSKATSEAGLETNSEEGVISPVDGTPSKDKSKLTREEREAQYKAARERIFGDFQESVTSESASTGENSASMSRSSSSSGKKKGRKHKTPKDDSFEARSAFIPSYAPMHHQHMQQQYEPHYADPPYSNPYQQAASNGYGPSMNYGTTPTQSYPNFDSSAPYNNGPMGYGQSNNQPFSPADSWTSMQSVSSNGYFNYPASPSNYQQNISPIMPQMNNQFMPPQSHPGIAPSQNWMNNQFQTPYPPSQGPPTSNMNGWSGYQSSGPINNGTAYGYAQSPVQNYTANATPSYGPQFPASNNNYSRSLFNPQTRSFVPSNAPSRTGGRNNNIINNNSNNAGPRKRPSPPGNQMRANSGPKPFMPGGMPAGSGATAPMSMATQPPSLPPPGRVFDKGPVPANMLSSAKPQAQQQPVKEDSLQQKYGAPAHLPKKPPPSQVPSSYDVEGLNAAGMNSATMSLNVGANGPVAAGAPGGPAPTGSA